MIELIGNIFDIAFEKSAPPTILLVTTNGFFNAKGQNIMGAGFAKSAKEKFPGIAQNLGTVLSVQYARLRYSEGADEIEPWNIPYKIGTSKNTHVFSFPTKPTWVVVTKETVLSKYYSNSQVGSKIEGWKAKSQLPLIERSAKVISDLVNSSLLIERVLTVRPGCSNGGLEWAQVKPVLDTYFDDRYTIVERG